MIKILRIFTDKLKEVKEQTLGRHTPLNLEKCEGAILR
jgi:hypothetical protein